MVMEAARASETLVNFYQTTQCYNPEDSHLNAHKNKKQRHFFPNYGLLQIKGKESQYMCVVMVPLNLAYMCLSNYHTDHRESQLKDHWSKQPRNNQMSS
jgi:hypothetical protein